MDQDAKAMMASMAQAMLAGPEAPSNMFSRLVGCMRGPCQQEISKCRQGGRSPCPPKYAKAQARVMCDDLRVRIMLRETARCNTNAKIAQGVRKEIAKRAKAQNLPDTPEVRQAMLEAEMDMLREMGSQCATTATANDPEYVDCMQNHQTEFMAACAAANCQERMGVCVRQKCAGIFPVPEEAGAAASASD